MYVLVNHSTQGLRKAFSHFLNMEVEKHTVAYGCNLRVHHYVEVSLASPQAEQILTFIRARQHVVYQ